MNEYPKEVQDVLDVAVAWMDACFNEADDALVDAIDAYRQSIASPEPFGAYLHFYDLNDAGGWYVDNSAVPEDNEQKVWRCTVTPIERVK